jgi:hypothetical protein
MFNDLYMNNVTNRPFDNFVWSVDDLYNNSVSICFKEIGTSNGYIIASQNFNNSVNEIIQFNYLYPGTYTALSNLGLPRSLNFYTASTSKTSNYYRYVWNSLQPKDKNMITFLNNPLGSGFDNLDFYLEEIYPEQSITFNFTRLLDLEFFDFYYASGNDQYKYVTMNTKFNGAITSANTTFNRNELQVDGYLPTLLNQDTSQKIFKILSMGNIDRSLYALVETCN